MSKSLAERFGEYLGRFLDEEEGLLGSGFGSLARGLTYLMLVGAMAGFWPDWSVYQKPLAEITIAGVFGPVLWLLVALALVRAWFRPVPELKHAWRVWGLFFLPVFAFGCYWVFSGK